MTATTTATTKKAYALLGWEIVQIIGQDAETGAVLVKDTQDGAAALVNKSALLPLKRVSLTAVRVIIADEIVSGQIGAITSADTNGNRWAIVTVNGVNVITHFSRVLVG